MSTYENHGESGPDAINFGTDSEFKTCSHSCGSTHHFSLFVSFPIQCNNVKHVAVAHGHNAGFLFEYSLSFRCLSTDGALGSSNCSQELFNDFPWVVSTSYSE